MKHQTIENLLARVSILQQKYEEIATLTGENFNIFRVLKLEAREVRTHSAFLAELLHPKGSHGMGDVLLKLFLEEVRVENLEGKEIQYAPRFALADLQPEHAKAQAEYHIGSKTEDAGGRIDILVSSRNKKLIIENKIYAGDQEKQLVRYSNFDPTAPLYYLTLWANQRPNDHSKGDLEEGKHYKRISYEVEILKWLEKCREAAEGHALLSGTIKQYIYLIKHLTNKSLNKEMENELIGQVMKDKESYDAYLALWSLDVRIEFINKLIEHQLKLAFAKHGIFYKKHYLDKFGGYSYHFGWEAQGADNIDIGLAFYQTFYSYGFVKSDLETPISKKLDTYLNVNMKLTFPEIETMGYEIWPVWQNRDIDYEILLAIWEGRLGKFLEDLMGKLLGIVRG